VGNFDGVHRAHAHVLGEIVRRARESGAKAVAVTFEPHPARILRPDSDLKLLTPVPEKLRLLEATGIDAVLMLPFGRDLSLMTPRQFAERILRKKLHAREVHEGYNFRFGHKAAGDVTLLTQFGREMGFEVKVYSEQKLRGEPVSSTHIRKLLARGTSEPRPSSAGASLLHFGCPGAAAVTARSTPCPPSTWRATKSRCRKMASISPARAWERALRFGHERGQSSDVRRGFIRHVETHLLNFHPIELTPESEVKICFLDRLRDEIKFPSVEALREQIAKRCEEGATILSPAALKPIVGLPYPASPALSRSACSAGFRDLFSPL
jgi:riboflavin kinase / FMN adenylyltransferase